MVKKFGKRVFSGIRSQGSTYTSLGSSYEFSTQLKHYSGVRSGRMRFIGKGKKPDLHKKFKGLVEG